MGKIRTCLNSRMIDSEHERRGTENSGICLTLNDIDFVVVVFLSSVSLVLLLLAKPLS